MFAAGLSGVPRPWVLRLALGVGALAGATAAVMVAGSRAWQPWVFLIAADGTIIARWDNVLIPAELEAALDLLPDAFDR